MKKPADNQVRKLEGLPEITIRQLEVFRIVCHECSYTNAAHELRTNRASVKRICGDFERAVGRALFVEDGEKNVHPTEFARGLLGQMGNLSHAMRQLASCVRSLHEKGRILRLAAAGELFQGGLFTHFLSRLGINDTFRPCFLRIESNRFRTALLNAECDVYFGFGLMDCDRLDLIDLGPVPWQIISQGKNAKLPMSPTDLTGANWCLVSPDDDGSAAALRDEFHAAGATGGEILPLGKSHNSYQWIFRPDIAAREPVAAGSSWPHYRFFASLRKHHPYPELKSRLLSAAIS
ncbi:MAG: LysR family transcriptional regulator [Verrucomicrobiota bacterium]